MSEASSWCVRIGGSDYRGLEAMEACRARREQQFCESNPLGFRVCVGGWLFATFLSILVMDVFCLV